jgi:DNA-binding beta-propeller fold protein YncE
MVAPSGVTTTVAGNGAAGSTDGTGGPLGSTELDRPLAVARDAAGNLYVADSADGHIRKVAPDGTTVTLTGNIGPGLQDGNGCSAQFNSPEGLVVFGKLLYVTDTGNSRVRVIHLP